MDVTEENITASENPKRRVGFLIAAVILMLVVVGVAIAMGWSMFSDRISARADLESALDLVKMADETVLAVDEIVLAEITPLLARAAEEASGQVPAALADLEEAKTLLEAVFDDLDDEDQITAAVLRDAVQARLTMLAQAPILLEANVHAANALRPAESGIENMLEAEDLATQAVEKFNLQTKEGVTASTEFTNQALEKLAEAKNGFEAVQIEFPNADMSAFLAYVDAKIALLEKARTIDETWLADKIEEANELIEEHNEDDVAASELGEALPESETAPIAEAYDAITADATEAYFEARDLAAEADTRLRDLLGTDGET